MYCGVFENGKNTQQNKTEFIPYTEMTNIIDIVSNVDCHIRIVIYGLSYMDFRTN